MRAEAIEFATATQFEGQQRAMRRETSKQRPDIAFRRELVSLLPRLRRFGYGLTGNQDESDDLVQAACERALTRFRQWQPGTRMDSWVFCIMHSLWKNELRARQVRKRASFMQGGEDFFPRCDPSSEQLVVLREVFAAVMGLPEAQRVAVMLVYVDGFSYKEAAAVLRIPIGTVMSRLGRARLALADHFDDPRVRKTAADSG